MSVKKGVKKVSQIGTVSNGTHKENESNFF
jgi:hypothetical protein